MSRDDRYFYEEIYDRAKEQQIADIVNPEFSEVIQIVPFDPTHPWGIDSPWQYYLDEKGIIRTRESAFTLHDILVGKKISEYVKETIDEVLFLKSDFKIRSLGTSLGTTSSYNDIIRKLDAVIEKIKERKKHESEPDLRSEFAVFRELVAPLIAFIKQFLLSYATYAPTPEKKELYPLSSGGFIRSSIMYFTNDDVGKTRALHNAYFSGIDTKEFIYGQKFILDYLKPANLFRGHNIDTINARIDRLKSGITIENYARNGTYFYGWYNVEKMGWKKKATVLNDDGSVGKVSVRKPPYAPFHHAMKEALSAVESDFGKSSLIYKELANDI